MSEIVLYGVPGSPYVRSALLGLEEKGVNYRLAPLTVAACAGEEHRHRHPFGRIPVLDHGDFRALRDAGDPALSRCYLPRRHAAHPA